MLPTLSHLQFLILHRLVMHGRQWSADLQAHIISHGNRMSGPSFYQLMRRMERDGLVVGRTGRRPGSRAIARDYRVTDAGQEAWAAVQEFYQRHPAVSDAE